jgi:CheY-like chemotaxis protein
MDLTMPVLDGFAATRQLKADGETAHIPVLALTADVATSSPALALESGCDVVLAKPVTSAQLLAEIRRAFRRIISEQNPRGRTQG